MPEIAAIFFDAVGTLLFPRPSFHEVYDRVSRQGGGRQTADVIRRRFGEAFRRQEKLDEQGGWATSEEREYRRWRDIVNEVLYDVRDRESAFTALYDHFARPDAWHVAPAAADVFAALKPQGLALRLASNYDRRLHQVIAGFPVLQQLGPVVISSEIGWRKPAPQFFQHLCSSGPFQPSSVLFIGDDHVNDYQGALRAGLDAVLLDPDRRLPLLGPGRIDRLEDLIWLHRVLHTSPTT